MKVRLTGKTDMNYPGHDRADHVNPVTNLPHAVAVNLYVVRHVPFNLNIAHQRFIKGPFRGAVHGLNRPTQPYVFG
jgi:hypothetical protein